MNDRAFVPWDDLHLAHDVIHGLQLLSALFKIEAFCNNEKQIRKLNHREYKYLLKSLNFAASTKPKKTQVEVERFLYNVAEFVFE